LKQAERERRILELLAREPMSAQALADFGEMSAGQVYPALAKLEAEGVIISLWADGPYPRRRIYRLKVV
jgi:DNA-binding PadR family transcriptional regulator